MSVLIGLSKTRKKQSVDLGPLEAHCFCENEICFTLPDCNNVMIKVDATILANVKGNEERDKTKVNSEPDTTSKPSVI